MFFFIDKSLIVSRFCLAIYGLNHIILADRAKRGRNFLKILVKKALKSEQPEGQDILWGGGVHPPLFTFSEKVEGVDVNKILGPENEYGVRFSIRPNPCSKTRKIVENCQNIRKFQIVETGSVAHVLRQIGGAENDSGILFSTRCNPGLKMAEMGKI